MKPPTVHDREQEWSTLERLFSRDGPDLVFVLGRRRIGKSHVLVRFARQVGGVYYQATRRTSSEQLAHLTQVIGEQLDDVALRYTEFSSWERLFEYLADRATEDDPLLLVLDEFPYLAEAESALTSIVQAAWDHQWIGKPITVVLSGSYVTAMRALETADQPLYGRRTAKLHFRPFDVGDAAHFMPGYGALERLEAYSVFGHLPGHLARIDSRHGLAENVAAAILDPAGPLVDDAQHILDAFLADAAVHYSILEAIANGDRTWSRLTSRVGKSGGSLLRPLRWLEEMTLIQRVVPLTEAKPLRSKTAYYRIADPYLAFWYRWIAPLLRGGSIGMVEPRTLWEVAIRPGLETHFGDVFEEACREHVRKRRTFFEPLRVGQWWDAAAGEQLDVVAVGTDGSLLVGEAKWGSVTREDLTALRRRGRIVASKLGTHGALQLVFFSARDEADATIRASIEAGEVRWLTAEDVAGRPSN